MRYPVLASLLIAGCRLVYGRTSSEFEVASVKQLDQTVQPGRPDLSFVGTSGKPFHIAGHRVGVRGTLRALIADADGVKEYQVSAAPQWADTLIYEITATTPGDAVATQDQVRAMLQSLLADRFQLKVHPDTRELPLYRLRQVKKSNLLKPAGPDETLSWKLSQIPDGFLRSKAFVQLVGFSADRPVIDKTREGFDRNSGSGQGRQTFGELNTRRENKHRGADTATSRIPERRRAPAVGL